MSALTKILVVMNLVFAVALAFSGLVYFSHANNYRELYQESQKELTAARQQAAADRAAYDASREILTARNDFLNGALDRERVVLAQMEKAQQDLVQQVRERQETVTATLGRMQDVQMDVRAAHEERKNALADRDQARAERDQAVAIQKADSAQAADLQSQLELLRLTHVDLDKRYQDVVRDLQKKDVILAKLKDQYGEIYVEGAQPRIRGTVMMVDEASGVVVMNVGSNNQVKVGYEFSVTRDDKFIGKIQVTDVNPDWAGAVLVRGMSKGTVKIGDQVATVIE